jgi:hypothetical protein
MDDLNKKAFWTMINVAMELTNHPPLTKEAVVVWWHKLSKFEYSVVEAALDKWVDSSSKAPAPSDILNLCKPVTPIYTALARKSSREAGKQYAENVVKFVAENTASKTDYKAWAKRIVANPERFPDSSLVAAKEALKASA